MLSAQGLLFGAAFAFFGTGNEWTGQCVPSFQVETVEASLFERGRQRSGRRRIQLENFTKFYIFNMR